MREFVKSVICVAFIIFPPTFTDGTTCSRKGSESCQHVGSLKGLVYMMESVTSALSDVVSSAKFRMENVEDAFCISPKNKNCSILSSTEDDDHCVRAEPDCKSLFDAGFKESGLYRIWPKFLNHSLIAYCDMDNDGGGWTVVQRRGDFEPHINFYETWSNFMKGFGDVSKEFWIGNDVLFAMTNEVKTTLRIDLEDFTGDKRYAKYRNFLVRSEVEKYNMTIGEYEGNAGDSLRMHNGREFSTKDRGNDCPRQFKGGWWYAQCHEANLNGIYHHGEHKSFADGINWFHFRGHHHSMKVAEMKIRRCDC